MDCLELWRQLRAARPWREDVKTDWATAHPRDPARFRLLLTRAGLTERQFELRKSCWDCDHIVEVTNGGGSCDLSNLQTLCCRCHKEKTAQLNRRSR
ncbi:MAG: HNH endonuclease [Armatimonadetes bacterium]|nr:HNH endonuclease [Armatimonadota bacterium]